MTTPVTKVGCIGLGVMGGNMARHLAARFAVTIFDADPSRLDAVANSAERSRRGAGSAVGGTESPAGGAGGGSGPLGAASLIAARSVAEVAEASEVVLLSLPGSPVVREVALGENGLIHHLPRSSVVVDASTTEPRVSREVAARLAEAGVDFLDAPVSGGEKGAREATLSIMVGGKQHVFERCLPVLETIGQSVVRIGEAGMGGVAKLVNNMIVASTFAVIAEGFALAAKNGVDPQTLYDAIRGGWAGSKVLDVSATGMVERNFTPGGTVDMMLKDVGYALSLASQSSVPVPATSQANEVFKAAQAAGYGAEAQQAIIKVWESLTGIHVGRSS